jgi:hypothetical protein
LRASASAAFAAATFLAARGSARPLDEPPYRVAGGPEIQLLPAPAAGVRAQVAFNEQLSLVAALLEDLDGRARELRLGAEYVIDVAPVVPFASVSVSGYLGAASWGVAGRVGLGVEVPWGPLAVGAELFLAERLAGDVPFAPGSVGVALRAEFRWPFRDPAAAGRVSR